MKPSAPHIRIPIVRIRHLILVVVAGLWLSFTPPVNAHARLEGSSIAPGAILPAVPDRIVLTFTEAIEPAFSSASLIRPDQSIAGQVTVDVDPGAPGSGRFTLIDSGSLPPGSYALLWRVVSAVDGHTTSGVLAFSAGTGAAPEIASTNDASGGNWSGTIGRWLEFAGFMAMAGAALLVIIGGDPGSQLRRVVALALPVAIGGLIITAFNLFASATGEGFGAWPGFSRAGDLLLDPTLGNALLMRSAMAGLIALVVVIDRRGSQFLPPTAAAASLIALGTFPFIGHAAGLRGNTAIMFDLIHLFGAAFWAGGLLFVAISLWKRRAAPPGDALVRLVTRYSWLALIVFAVIAISGFAGAWFNVAGPRNLTGEAYGLTLILKVVLSILVVAMAAVNRLILVPQLRRSEPAARESAASSLRRFTLVELGIAVAILVLAARLTSIPPADAPLTVDVATRSGPIHFTGAAGDLAFELVGELRNTPDGIIRIAITETATGAPASDLVRVIVDARAPDPLDPAGEPIQDRFDATPVGNELGVYEVPRSRLGLEAEWQFEVIARRLGLADEAVAVTLDLRGTAPQPPRLVQEEWRLPRLPWSGYLALAAAAATIAGSLFLIRRLKGLEPVTAGILLSVAAMITIGFLLSAWRSGPIPVGANDLPVPVNPGDPAAIQRAASTWLTQCASCHGVDGGGTGDDQPDGGHAHPSVAGDLLGRQTRARTPAELYWIVTNGLGGTAMPAFNLALTDQQRTDLTAYLLWLQKQSSD